MDSIAIAKPSKGQPCSSKYPKHHHPYVRLIMEKAKGTP